MSFRKLCKFEASESFQNWWSLELIKINDAYYSWCLLNLLHQSVFWDKRLILRIITVMSFSLCYKHFQISTFSFFAIFFFPVVLSKYNILIVTSTRLLDCFYLPNNLNIKMCCRYLQFAFCTWVLSSLQGVF